MTVNQLMVLLDVYRGTYDKKRHMADAQIIIGDLCHQLYVTSTPQYQRANSDAEIHYFCTMKGIAYIERILQWSP